MADGLDLVLRPAALSSPTAASHQGLSAQLLLKVFSPEKAMRVLTDAKKPDPAESDSIEIGGTHDGRHSTPAKPRSSLTELAPAPTVSLYS